MKDRLENLVLCATYFYVDKLLVLQNFIVFDGIQNIQFLTKILVMKKKTK